MTRRGCCSWLFCRGSTEEEDETTTTEDGTTTIVRKTTRNGATVVTTTTTTYTSHPTSIRTQITEPELVAFLPREPSNRIVAKATPTVTPTTGHQFEVESLNEHNRFRALHGCPPLKLNSKLSAIAKKWAIHMANINNMRHSQNDKYGENLYMCSGFSINGKKPVESWYNEIKLYDFRRPKFSMKTGHFTQVLWKESKELGVGVEIRGNTTWVVANYDPPGNVATCYEQNVPRLL